MKTRIVFLSCVFLISLIWHTSTLSQVSGRVVLDRENLLVCMPITGVVELEPVVDVEMHGSLAQALGMTYGGHWISIETPLGDVVEIDGGTMWRGLSVNRGSPVGSGAILQKGVTYVIPVFLLKIEEKFLFDVPGQYIVRFHFDGLPEKPVFKASVDVETCVSCGREQFVNSFRSDSIILRPFSGDVPRVNVTSLEESDPYLDAYIVSMANQSGGAFVRKLYNYDLASFAGEEWCQSLWFRDQIDAGMMASQVTVSTRGIWDNVYRRLAYIDNDDFAKDVPRTDELGRVVVLWD